MVSLKIDQPNSRQLEFFKADTRFIAYGGARGGGKSWAIRTKAILGALKYSKIRILIIRRTYSDLEENHITPLLEILYGVAKYNESKKLFTFGNGSKIKLGFCDTEKDTLQYQGREYDWIFIDEATQLSEFQFDTFKACNRGVNDIPKRIYLSCNPGGIGHAWVKRLFIDRKFKTREKPDEYTFIQAKVYDNKPLLDKDPDYLETLKSLPDQLRAAWLDGSWDIYAGQYFTEFDEDIHVIKPFKISDEWLRFRMLDYGQDTTACLWGAVDNKGRVYIYRELHEPNLTLSGAAKKIVSMTGKNESIRYTVASPDLWNKRQESGKSGVEIMLKDGGLAGLRRAENRRIPGWRLMREYLRVDAADDGNQSPNLFIFNTCTNLIESIPALLHDEKNVEDVSDEPHQYTHAPEALRYGLKSRPPLPRKKDEKIEPLPDRSSRTKQKQYVVGGKVNIRGLF